MTWKKYVSSVIVGLILINPLFADLSSLTDKELDKYEKALLQAQAYKYYSALVQGEDQVKVTKNKLLDTHRISDTRVRKLYEVYIDLTIDDKVFKRVIEVSLDVNLSDSYSMWTDWRTYTIVGLVVIIVLQGILKR